MSSTRELPGRVPKYLRVLAEQYKNAGNRQLETLLSSARVQVSEHTDEEDWGSGIGHDVLLFLPIQVLGKITPTARSAVCRTITEDLNQASTGVLYEYINAVHLEPLDDHVSEELNTTPASLISPNDAGKSAGDRSDCVHVFISHRHTHKRHANHLGMALEQLGFDPFVAHAAIEPDTEWAKEIDRALESMDCMVALLSDDFFEKPWTNQEVGYAKGRSIPLLCISYVSKPTEGLIAPWQALEGNVDNPKSEAEAVFKWAVGRLNNARGLLNTAIKRLSKSSSFLDAERNFEILKSLDNFEQDQVDTVVAAFNANSQLHNCHYIGRDGNLVRFLKRVSGLDYELVGTELKHASDNRNSCGDHSSAAYDRPNAGDNTNT